MATPEGFYHLLEDLIRMAPDAVIESRPIPATPGWHGEGWDGYTGQIYFVALRPEEWTSDVAALLQHLDDTLRQERRDRLIVMNYSEFYGHP